MWMGGLIPLGYDLRDHRLTINEAEAATVRHIFRTYLEQGSVRLLKDQLAAEGVRSKRRSSARSGKQSGGSTIERGALYLILQNPVYRGEVHHQGNTYSGEHEAIIDAATWEAVQAQLAANRNEQQSGTRAENPSLLAGLVCDQQGERLVPTHASKSGRRYRYYVSKPLLIDGAKANADGLRVPAVDLERIVTDRLLSFLRDRSEVFAAIRGLVPDGTAQRQMLERASQTQAEWADSAASERRVLLRRLLSRISVHVDTVTLHVSPTRLTALLANMPEQPPSADYEGTDLILLTTPVRLMRSKQEMRMIVRSATEAAEPDPTLIRLIVKANLLREKLMQGGMQLGEVAAQEGPEQLLLHPGNAQRLSGAGHHHCHPDWAAAVDLTTFKLMADSRLPLDWDRAAQGAWVQLTHVSIN